MRFLQNLFSGEARSEEVPLATLRVARRESLVPQDPNEDELERHLYVGRVQANELVLMILVVGNSLRLSTRTTLTLEMSTTCSTNGERKKLTSYAHIRRTTRRSGSSHKRTDSDVTANY